MKLIDRLTRRLDSLLDDLADRIADRLLAATPEPVADEQVGDDRYTDFERALLANRSISGVLQTVREWPDASS
jgi:hypothetical protein